MIVRDIALAHPVVHTKGKVCLTHTWLTSLGTNVCARVLAELSSVLVQSIAAVVTVAGVRFQAVGLFSSHTGGTVKAHLLPAGTDLQLVLALNSEITIGADTVLPKLVCLIVSGEIVPKLGKERIVLGTCAANPAVVTLQVTDLLRLLVVSELANRSMETIQALATNMSFK